MTPSYDSGTRTEFDPLGADVGRYDPYPSQFSYTDVIGNNFLYNELGNPFDLGGGCARVDGMPMSCSELQNRMENGTVVAEYPGVWRNGRNGRIVEQRKIISYGVGLFGIWLPDGARDNDEQWDLYLFSFRNPPRSNSRTKSHHVQQTNSCDVQMPDERARILLGVILEETTPTHHDNGTFSFDQFTKDANDNSMIHFQGGDAVQELSNEIFYMASALINQVSEGLYGGSLEAAAKGESVAYNAHGQRRNSELNASPEYCLKARLLLANLNYIDRYGAARFENGDRVRYWRGVAQNGKRNFRKGDVRAGNSDFMYLPPQKGGKRNPAYYALPYWRNGRWTW